MNSEQVASNSTSTTLCSVGPPHKDFGVLAVPSRLRYDPGRQLDLGWWTQLGLSFGCTCVGANLYYCQPLLIQIAKSFNVTYATVAWIPTLYQGGYCIGLFFISPLGDMVRRRQLIMALICITICLSVALALSRNLAVFCTLAVLIGVFNVTPQILIPLAADLAAPHRRAGAVSILQSGLMLGILLARVLAGVIAYFTTWRAVYYMAIGVQVVVLCGAYVLVPDHPPKNPHLTYMDIMCTMVTYSVTEPRLVQAALINIASVAGWTNFWVTLTFLLGDDPYHYSTWVLLPYHATKTLTIYMKLGSLFWLYIGLFGLIGILGIFSGPLAGRFIDRSGSWFSVLVATLCLLVLQCVEMAAGGIHIAVVVIVCFGMDAFRQAQTVSLQSIVFSISEEARSRLNAMLTVSLFGGQVIGSSAGSHVFLRYGWRAAAALSVGLYGWQLLVLFMRGPNCGRHVWFGYEGGFSSSDERKLRQERSAEIVSHAASNSTKAGLTALENASETWTAESTCCPGDRV